MPRLASTRSNSFFGSRRGCRKTLLTLTQHDLQQRQPKNSLLTVGSGRDPHMDTSSLSEPSHVMMEDVRRVIPTSSHTKSMVMQAMQRTKQSAPKSSRPPPVRFPNPKRVGKVLFGVPPSATRPPLPASRLLKRVMKQVKATPKPHKHKKKKKKISTRNAKAIEAIIPLLLSHTMTRRMQNRTSR